MKSLAIILWATLLTWVGYDQIQRWQKNDVVATSAIDTTTVPLDNYDPLTFVDYEDEDFGFSMVVPKHWEKLPPLDIPEYELLDERGYSVLFESPLQNSTDNYSDYIMVEVLPGNETGAFDSDGAHRALVTVDGQTAVEDKIFLSDFPVGDMELDLSIRQAEIAQLGYTVGLYTVGTKDNARMLEEAFRALLYSFKLPKQPYLMANSSAL